MTICKCRLLAVVMALTGLTALAQTGPGMQWALPLKTGRVPIGRPAENAASYLEGNTVFLQELGKPAAALPFDSISYIEDGYYQTWKNGLQGIFHPETGSVIPPVYEGVKPVGPKPRPWAFGVRKYGMFAIADDQNRLILPWTKLDYGKTAAYGDSILEYYKPRVGLSYVSRSGKPVDEATARLSKPADFQRLTTEWIVLTTVKNGLVRRDSFRETEPFTGDVTPVRPDQLWGYIRRDASWLIKPRFQAARPFDARGHAVVKTRDRYGVIRTDGSFVIEPRFTFLKAFVPGLFEFREGEQSGLVDTLGAVVVPLGAYGGFIAAGTNAVAAKSADSLLLFRRDGQPIRAGKLVACFSHWPGEAFAVLQKKPSGEKRASGSYGILSSTGNWLLEPVVQQHLQEHRFFYVAVAMLDNCCAVPGLTLESNMRDKFLIFNRKGQLVTPIPVGGLPSPGESPFVIYKVGKWYGMATSSGVFLDAEYDEIKDMGKGWAYARKGDAWGALKWVE